MSAARSQLSKDFDERGGSERVRGERGLEKAQKKIPPADPILQSSEFTQSQSTATHPSVSVPHFLPPPPPLCLYLLPLIFSLSQTLITLNTLHKI